MLGLNGLIQTNIGKSKVALEIMDLGIKSHQDSIESISHSGISMWPTVASFTEGDMASGNSRLMF